MMIQFRSTLPENIFLLFTEEPFIGITKDRRECIIFTNEQLSKFTKTEFLEYIHQLKLLH